MVATFIWQVGLENVLGIKAFELDRVVERDPAFLTVDEEYGHGHGQ